jgi:hypothetical protein
MAQRQYAPFGQGAQGFAKYYGGAFADQAIGNVMSEGLFAIALVADKVMTRLLRREFLNRGSCEELDWEQSRPPEAAQTSMTRAYFGNDVWGPRSPERLDAVSVFV